MRELSGKTAVLTGASKGLGPIIARALHERGVHLVLAARSIDAIQKLADELEDDRARAVAVPCDVSSESDRADLVARAVDAFGQVDILVNNAGLIKAGLFHEQRPEDIRQLMEVNLMAAMMLSHAVLPGMVERGEGHIVNMASLAGKLPCSYEASYSASKAGLLNFTHALRLEYREMGVSASAICPGLISDAGMWADVQADTGAETPKMQGATPAAKVGTAVVEAILKDKAELIVSARPVRPVLAAGSLFPRFMEWFLGSMAGEPYRDAAERDKSRE